jgi:hypothetical protein
VERSLTVPHESAQHNPPVPAGGFFVGIKSAKAANNRSHGGTEDHGGHGGNAKSDEWQEKKGGLELFPREQLVVGLVVLTWLFLRASVNLRASVRTAVGIFFKPSEEDRKECYREMPVLIFYHL